MSVKPKSLDFGFGTTTNSKVTINTSTTELRPAANRTLLILTNDTDYDVWLGFGVAAVAGEGVLLAKNGGNIILGKEANYKGAINGIAITSSTSISFVEVVE